MAEVEDVAAAFAVAMQNTAHFGADGFGRAEQGGRVEVALQRHLAAHVLPCLIEVYRRIQAERVGATFGHQLEPLAAAFGKQDNGHAAAFVFAGEAADDLAHIGQAELGESSVGEQAAPGVENLHGLGAGGDLFVQIGGYGLGGDVEDAVQQLGAAVEAVQRAVDGGNGVEYIAQLGHIGHLQRGNVGFALQRAGKFGPFAFGKIEAQAHGVGHGEDVGEEDGGIEAEAVDGLEGYFSRQLGVFAQIQKAACTGAYSAVFGQVAPGLAHEPHGGVGNGLFGEGAQEGVVLQGGHGGVCVVWMGGES